MDADKTIDKIFPGRNAASSSMPTLFGFTLLVTTILAVFANNPAWLEAESGEEVQWDDPFMGYRSIGDTDRPLVQSFEEYRGYVDYAEPKEEGDSASLADTKEPMLGLTTVEDNVKRKEEAQKTPGGSADPALSLLSFLKLLIMYQSGGY